MGWIANVILVWGWVALGNKHRYGIMLGILGSVIWAGIAYNKAMWDLITIEIVLAAVQVRAWWLWGRDDDGNNQSVHPGTACNK